MFLAGGTAFSGTTLLALMLNQGNLVCLDEPDFHNAKQNHRGIPLLRRLFPGVDFPPPPEADLDYPAATDLMERCETLIAPRNLGHKTCGSTFLKFLAVYRERGYPAIMMVRDIRDVLARPLPDWENEESMNRDFRMVWARRHLVDEVIRYEDLVLDTERTIERISRVLGVPLQARAGWRAEDVHDPMLKNDRHELLRSGAISRERIGIHRKLPGNHSAQSQETAVMMGYES